MRYIRWKALLPLSVTLGLMVIWSLIFKDRTVRWVVEAGGTAAVGAKVELESAHLGILSGNVSLRGLAVTNPNAPMTNLFEAEDLVFDVGILPMLEGKIVLDTAAARGLRFNTPRATSGAVPQEEQPPEVEETNALVESFKSRVKVPSIDLSTLQKSVNVDAIAAESLATLRAVNEATAFADSVQSRFTADLAAANPAPTLDSAEALANRLRSASLQSLGLNGVRRAVTDVRRTLADINRIDDRLKAVETQTRANAATLQQKVNTIGAAKTQDYAYARSLLQLPTFDVPSIGPQLMSDIVADQLGGVLYWVQMAEKYTPPGLTRRTETGPERVRASGTNVLFPKEMVYPNFLMRLAELSLTLGGEGATAGAYTARLEGVTTQPAVYGRPTTFLLDRSSSAADARDIRVAGVLDHRREPARDSVGARMNGIPLPRIPLGGLGATVQLGNGLSQLNLMRVGDSLSGEWLWRAPHVTWVRDSVRPSMMSDRGRMVDDAIWRAISRLDSVEIEARFGGTISAPTLSVRTNIANALGNALRESLGEEVRRAEQQVRGRVDALVDTKVAEARASADRVRNEVESRVAAERTRLDEQKRALEERLRALTRIPGVG